MRTLRIVIAAAIAALVVMVADPAAAKGPRSAWIDGPGLDAPIEEPEAAMSKLPTLTGLFGALWADTTIPLLGEAPTADLGPAWVITWDMGIYVDESGNESDSSDLVRQTVYPYAEHGPLVHTEPGQPFYAHQTVGGWYEAHSPLTTMLVMLGLPTEDEAVGSADDEDETPELAGSAPAGGAASADGSSIGWIAVAGALTLLVAAPLARLRWSRHRTA